MAGRPAGERTDGARHVRLIGEPDISGNLGERLRSARHQSEGTLRARFGTEGGGGSREDHPEPARESCRCEPEALGPNAEALLRVREQIPREEIGPVRGLRLERPDLLVERLDRRAGILLGNSRDSVRIGDAAPAELRFLLQQQIEDLSSAWLEAVEMGIECPVQQYLA